MTSGSDEGRGRPPEPTFADVMNGFSFDSARAPRRRRWGRRRSDPGGEQIVTPGSGSPGAVPPPLPGPPTTPLGRSQLEPPPEQPSGGAPTQSPGPILDRPTVSMPPVSFEAVSYEAMGEQGGAAAVRPYAWTRGRTKPGLDLAIETLVSTSQRGTDQIGLLQLEHRSVAELCMQPRSVAEVAALLSIPLGVARVLLGDMAGMGMVTVHQTASSPGTGPDLALMERVLSGLRRL